MIAVGLNIKASKGIYTCGNDNINIENCSQLINIVHMLYLLAH